MENFIFCAGRFCEAKRTPRVGAPDAPALALCLAFCNAASAASDLSSASSRSTTAFLYFDCHVEACCS